MGKTVAEAPDLCSGELIGYADRAQYIPMMGEYPECADQRMTCTIHMVRLGTTSVKLQDRKVFSSFKVID